MTADEEAGKAMYEWQGRGWPNLMPWAELLKGTQHLWIQRAKKGNQ